jgi:hypothetical protein
MFTRHKLLVPSLLLVPFLTPGCDAPPPPPEPDQVVLRLEVVPPDVSCLRLLASGPGRTVARDLEVVPGTPLVETFSGLPLGTVRFSAEAFEKPCADVTRSTVPAWVSEAQEVSVVLGRLSSVSLSMVRNGRAKVGVLFTDEPACTAAGSLCTSNAACCSGSCQKGSCAVPPDSGG